MSAKTHINLKYTFFISQHKECNTFCTMKIKCSETFLDLKARILQERNFTCDACGLVVRLNIIYYYQEALV